MIEGEGDGHHVGVDGGVGRVDADVTLEDGGVERGRRVGVGFAWRVGRLVVVASAVGLGVFGGAVLVFVLCLGGLGFVLAGGDDGLFGTAGEVEDGGFRWRLCLWLCGFEVEGLGVEDEGFALGDLESGELLAEVGVDEAELSAAELEVGGGDEDVVVGLDGAELGVEVGVDEVDAEAWRAVEVDGVGVVGLVEGEDDVALELALAELVLGGEESAGIGGDGDDAGAVGVGDFGRGGSGFVGAAGEWGEGFVGEGGAAVGGVEDVLAAFGGAGADDLAVGQALDVGGVVGASEGGEVGGVGGCGPGAGGDRGIAAGEDEQEAEGGGDEESGGDEAEALGHREIVPRGEAGCNAGVALVGDPTGRFASGWLGVGVRGGAGAGASPALRDLG
ncbi:MAG: hypothetical protein AAFY08_14525 [Planctomycetota bacterium]